MYLSTYRLTYFAPPPLLPSPSPPLSPLLYPITNTNRLQPIYLSLDSPLPTFHIPLPFLLLALDSLPLHMHHRECHLASTCHLHLLAHTSDLLRPHARSHTPSTRPFPPPSPSHLHPCSLPSLPTALASVSLSSPALSPASVSSLTLFPVPCFFFPFLFLYPLKFNLLIPFSSFSSLVPVFSYRL